MPSGFAKRPKAHLEATIVYHRKHIEQSQRVIAACEKELEKRRVEEAALFSKGLAAAKENG